MAQTKHKIKNKSQFVESRKIEMVEKNFVEEDDPFYSEANMNRLRAAIEAVKSGKSTLKEHDLIEVEDA